MPFASALSTQPTTPAALSEVCARIQATMPEPPDLVLAFFSPQHGDQAELLARGLVETLRPSILLGSIGEAIVGTGREVERAPALSVWAARWARPVTQTAFHLTYERTGDGLTLLGWPDVLGGVTAEPTPEPFVPTRTAVLLLGDPFTFPTEAFLERMNTEVRGVPVLGGMASGISEAGQVRLLHGGTVHQSGAVGVVLQGELGLRSIVSQGCRPIGRPLVITKAEENVILELGGRTPFDHLRQLWDDLTPEEQALFQKGLHIGRVLNEYQGEFQRGDFLVRNVLGIERQSGALVITDHVRRGQTVQFHVRDAASADEDLRALLQLDLHANEKRPAGGLLFSCNGRGTRLFDRPDHDAEAIRQEMGELPLAGFFAMGELGPVGGQNFIHGFTASVALFED
ncbi:MAG: FIST N-terminal domain-containing protein [Gemmataceae bacterium]